MAIDPKLLVIKPVNELESVTGLQAGELLFYDGSNNLKKIDIDAFNNLSKTVKPLKPTDPTPTGEGLYMPTESGTYANAGSLIAQEGYYTLFFFDGTTWTKSESKLPQATQSIVPFSTSTFPLIAPTPPDPPIQRTHDNSIWQLKDGETAASTDVPGVSDKWGKLNDSDRSTLINSVRDIDKYPSPFKILNQASYKKIVEKGSERRKVYLQQNWNTSGGVTKLRFHMARKDFKDWDVNQIERIWFTDANGLETDVNIIYGSYYNLTGDVLPLAGYGRSDTSINCISSMYVLNVKFIAGSKYSPIDFLYDMHFCNTSGSVLDRTSNKAEFGVDIEIPVFKYTNWQDLLAGEGSGFIEINIEGDFNSVDLKNCKMKNGWLIRGWGIGSTNFKQEYNTSGLSSAVAGFFLENNSTLQDMTITSVSKGEGLEHYAIHIDNGAEEFSAKIKRVRFISENLNPNDPSVGVSSLIGLGAWSGQNIEFEDCIMIAQSLHYGSKNIVNSHNQTGSASDIKGGRVSFKGCSFIGGFCTLNVGDTSGGTMASKTVWEFISCNIDNINFISFGAVNRFIFNCAASNIGLLTSPEAIANPQLVGYDATSLPVTNDIKFLKNLGTSVINQGSLVSYVYADRSPHWWAGVPTYNVPIGIELTTSANKDKVAGIALLTANVGNACHIRVKGEVMSYLATGGIGDYLYIQADGTLSPIDSGTPFGRITSINSNTNRIIDIL